MEKGQEITVTCKGYNEGTGFSCETFDGILGIIPKEEASFYPLKFQNQINLLTKRKIKCEIIETSPLTLSRKRVTEKRINELLSGEGPVGKIVEAEVVSANTLALYVDMGDGVSGIIYKGDIISTPFTCPPTDIFPIGSKLFAKIKSVKEDKGFFTLSHRAIFPRNNNYTRGMHIMGIVRSPIFNGDKIGGYFVEITPAVGGILDVNEGFSLFNGEKIPMVINDVTSKGLRLRLEFPN